MNFFTGLGLALGGYPEAMKTVDEWTAAEKRQQDMDIAGKKEAIEGRMVNADDALKSMYPEYAQDYIQQYKPMLSTDDKGMARAGDIREFAKTMAGKEHAPMLSSLAVDYYKNKKDTLGNEYNRRVNDYAKGLDTNPEYQREAEQGGDLTKYTDTFLSDADNAKMKRDYDVATRLHETAQKRLNILQPERIKGFGDDQTVVDVNTGKVLREGRPKDTGTPDSQAFRIAFRDAKLKGMNDTDALKSAITSTKPLLQMKADSDINKRKLIIDYNQGYTNQNRENQNAKDDAKVLESDRKNKLHIYNSALSQWNNAIKQYGSADDVPPETYNAINSQLVGAGLKPMRIDEIPQTNFLGFPSTPKKQYIIDKPHGLDTPVMPQRPKRAQREQAATFPTPQIPDGLKALNPLNVATNEKGQLMFKNKTDGKWYFYQGQ